MQGRRTEDTSTLVRENASHENRDPIIQLENASVSFEMERGQSRVLDDVSISVERGEILGIVGESGSGKSMCASSMLDAIVDPGRLTGDITYHPADGAPVNLLELDDDELKEIRWEEISMVVQSADTAFNPTMTIRDHFQETIEHHDADMGARMAHAHELLEDLYLPPERVMDSYPYELSGGMKQRALIALALVLEPDLLVMDEPTASLDLLMQRSIVSLLYKLKKKYDLTLVFVTHDLPLIADIADRLAVMYAFEMVEVGPTEEIIHHAAHPYSRALINAVPNVNSPVTEMQPIEGSSPDSVNVPSGCSYHPRCPIAKEKCQEIAPPLAQVDSDADHTAACHYTDEAVEEISLNKSTDYEMALDDTAASSSSKKGDPVLELRDLTVEFTQSRLLGLKDAKTVRAVNDVSLEIFENDVVALVGESGCGKTTLGKVAVGLQRPTDGQVLYRDQEFWETKKRDSAFWRGLGSSGDEKRYTHNEMRRALQIIHQDPGSSLNQNYTIIRLLSTPLQRWYPELSEDDRRARIYGLLEFAGMTPPQDFANRYPHQLSGGEQQRVALIRTLLMNPDLILADEAVSALDVSLRIEMMDLMLELQNQADTSFLFVAHDLGNARYITKKANGRIGIMYLGELVEIGPVEEVMTNPKHPYTKVLMWATPDLFDDETTAEEPPVRSLDIPEAADPPSGCPFHTRCPKAREVCTHVELEYWNVGDAHEVACFRAEEDHEYWESEPLPGVEEEERI